MDEEIQGFVSDSLPPFHTGIHESSNSAFVPNGSDKSAHSGAAYSNSELSYAEKKHHKKHHKKHYKHHGHKDVIADGHTPEVHGFVTDNLPPLHTRQYVDSVQPFVPNGSDPSAWEGAAF